MNFEHYEYKKSKIKLIIKEDRVGYYLLVYSNPDINGADHDYLLDDLESALFVAQEKFGVKKDEWTKIND